MSKENYMKINVLEDLKEPFFAYLEEQRKRAGLEETRKRLKQRRGAGHEVLIRYFKDECGIEIHPEMFCDEAYDDEYFNSFECIVMCHFFDEELRYFNAELLCEIYGKEIKEYLNTYDRRHLDVKKIGHQLWIPINDSFEDLLGWISYKFRWDLNFFTERLFVYINEYPDEFIQYFKESLDKKSMERSDYIYKEEGYGERIY